MKICTFNINSIKARKDLMLEWLKHRNQDIHILCLQELKSIPEQFPYQDFKNLGFDSEVFGQKTYNGVAICSKYPIESIQKGFHSNFWDEQKRLIAAKIKGLNLINIYAPHGGFRGEEKFDYKKKWYKTFIKFLDDHYSPQDPILMAGDFNVAREDRDVYNPSALEDSIGTMPEEREAFQNLLDWGFTDGFRHLYPQQIQFTWWDYIGGAMWRNEGMRIDYILCTDPLKDTIKTIEVDLWPRRRRTPKPSDHAPVIASLDISNP